MQLRKVSNNSQKKKKAVKLGDGKKFETFDPSNESLTQATGKNSPLIDKQHLPCKLALISIKIQIQINHFMLTVRLSIGAAAAING